MIRIALWCTAPINDTSLYVVPVGSWSCPRLSATCSERVQPLRQTACRCRWAIARRCELRGPTTPPHTVPLRAPRMRVCGAPHVGTLLSTRLGAPARSDRGSRLRGLAQLPHRHWQRGGGGGCPAPKAVPSDPRSGATPDRPAQDDSGAARRPDRVFGTDSGSLPPVAGFGAETEDQPG